MNGAHTGHAMAPVAVDDCSEEQLQSYAATFDGDTLHAAEDLWRVLRSRVGYLSLRWRLHKAGYAARVELASRHYKYSLRKGFDLAQVTSMKVAYGRAGEGLNPACPGSRHCVEIGLESGHLEGSETFAEFVEANVQSLSVLA